MTAIAYVALAGLGLIVGSFLTMVIDRVPDRLSVTHPGPRCPYCEHDLAAADLVPVVSWLALRGRCRYCDHAITPAYPAVEIVTAAAFVLAAVRIGFQAALVPVLVFFATLIALSVVDLYRYRIPDRILFPGLGLSIIGIVVVSVSRDQAGLVSGALVGAVLYFVILLIPHLAYPKGMGFGDVKLALLLGLFLGWAHDDLIYSLRLILFALLIGAVLASVGGAILVVVRKMSQRAVLPDPETDDADQMTMFGASMPFGPALALSAAFAFLFSNELLGL